MKNLLLIICLFNIQSIIGQTMEPRQVIHKSYNKIYLEAGGQGLYYSLNYERIVETQSVWFPSWRVGTTYAESYDFHVGLNLNRRLNRGQISTGFATTTYWENQIPFPGVDRLLNFSGVVLFYKLGYEYSKKESKWFFGGAFLPIIAEFERYEGRSFRFFPWGGLQIGYYL